MVRRYVEVPITVANNEDWGALHFLAASHVICGEEVREINPKFSFKGGHRIRHYRFKKNVHWKIPAGVDIDIREVPLATAPRRQQRR